MKVIDSMRDIVNRDFQAAWFVLKKILFYWLTRNYKDTDDGRVLWTTEGMTSNYLRSLGGMYIHG